MDKINFQNLPSTETPINADNLNKLQDNVENAIGVVDDKVSHIDFELLQDANNLKIYRYGDLVIGHIENLVNDTISAYTAIATINSDVASKITRISEEIPVTYRIVGPGGGATQAYFSGNKILFPLNVSSTVFNITGYFFGIYTG